VKEIQNSKFKIQNAPRRGSLHGTAAACAAFCLLTFAFCISPARAQSPNFLTGFSDNQGALTSASPQKPEVLDKISFHQRLNEKLPLDAVLTDESGQAVALGEYFTGGAKPVILAFVYFDCPMLCTQVMNGISSSLRALSLEAGKDFDVVLVSFDPRDTPAKAAEKKRTHLDYWKTENTAAGWHFLTGDEATIRRVASAAGFTYQWDEATKQFAHVSGVLVVTPDGVLSRYFYGIEYSPRELRMALVESSQGHIGSLVDELLLYCFHYDPLSGKYGVVIMNLIRAGGLLTIAFIVGVMLLARRRDPQLPHAGRA
jgi:protein SCO1/2